MDQTKKIQFESNAHHYEDPILKVFRIHPHGVRIEKAEKTLKGSANKDALTWCGPYSYANTLGWWVYPGFDIDITCLENYEEGCYTGRWGGHFRYETEGYDHSDFEQMFNFAEQAKNSYDYTYTGKQHFAIDEPEKNCISLWTGCFFQMPKDWALLIKTPTNIGLIYDQGAPACVQEGILEVDWMRYDIWTNFKFHTFGKTLSLRKNQDWPIAQLIPIHKSSYMSSWQTQEFLMDAEIQDCVDVYERYCEYNHKKWILQGEKDPFTFKKLRKSEQNQCPFSNLFKESK
jgi:hypothetical protein